VKSFIGIPVSYSNIFNFANISDEQYICENVS